MITEAEEIQEAAPLASMLRVTRDIRQTVQKQRIRISNQLSALKRQADTAREKDKAMLGAWLETFESIEARANKDLTHAVRHSGLKIYDHLIEIRGIGDITAAKILVEIDIQRADTISALWRYAGYGVVDGKREKPVKGEKLHYNRELKIAVRLAAESFIKAKSPYAGIYYATKEKWMSREGVTKMHAHNAALGKVAKVFLSHLWLIWRELEGLPVTNPYAIDQLGHDSMLRPGEFGWACSSKE